MCPAPAPPAPRLVPLSRSGTDSGSEQSEKRLSYIPPGAADGTDCGRDDSRFVLSYAWCKGRILERFVVLSGCSSGGKSTLLAELERRGHAVVAEPGRRVVAEQRACRGSALPWADPMAFAERAIEMALADRDAASRMPGLVFFDRGLIDAVVALEHAAGRPRLDRAAAHRYYSTVFFAPPWREIFVRDADRRHGWDDAVAEYARLERGFAALGYTIETLPKVTVGERVDFVLSALSLA